MQHFKFENCRIGEFDFWCHELLNNVCRLNIDLTHVLKASMELEMSKSKVENIWFSPAILVHDSTMKISSFCISMTLSCEVSILDTSYSKLGRFLHTSDLV